MFRLFFVPISIFMAAAVFPLSAAPLTCVTTGQPIIVHGEGITERTGDLVFTCTGGIPDATVTVNLSVFLNVNITNRLASGTSDNLLGISLTADNGAGPQTISAQPTLTGQASLTFDSATFTLSPTGSVTLQMSGLRGAANLLNFAPNSLLQALIGFTSNVDVAVSSNPITVGTPVRGLYDAFSGILICSQKGSPAPATPTSFASFLASGTAFTSTRVTEGFAASFAPLSDISNQGADTGTRILVQYSGFPAGAQLYVPTVVAGSDATQPTAGGDLGMIASGGKYTPGTSSLLLSLVQNANSSGAGGFPLYTPGAAGSGTVTFDSVSPITLTNGAGFAVYQVMDASPSTQESAQFPTFLTLAPFSGASVQTAETVSLAPISTVYTATATDPIPRFQQVTIPEDCSIVGDCNARYFPQLSVSQSSMTFRDTDLTQQLTVENLSGGVMPWTTSISYANGSGWLELSPAQGQNSQNIRIEAVAGTLAPGTYNATLTVNAGPTVGTSNVAISFVVAASTAPAAQAPSLQSLVNGATFAKGPVAPGSMATIGGTQFAGKTVTVAFDGLDAPVLFSNDTQINLIVPASLGSKTSAQVIVTVNGTPSAPLTATLAPFAPGIFSDGVLNQDNSLNSSKKPAAPGSIIQVYATGLSGTGVITAKIGSEEVKQPYYAGPAPGIPGMQQIDLILPSNPTGNSVSVSVCGGASASKVVCSPAVAVAVSK